MAVGIMFIFIGATCAQTFDKMAGVAIANIVILLLNE